MGTAATVKKVYAVSPQWPRISVNFVDPPGGGRGVCFFTVSPSPGVVLKVGSESDLNFYTKTCLIRKQCKAVTLFAVN